MPSPLTKGRERISRVVFPKWTNRLRTGVGVAAAVVPLYVVFLVAYGASPRTTDVGYQPVQPLAYSHARHAGDLGIDCRYCHNTVEQTAHALIPPTQTCMNCHAKIVLAAEGGQPNSDIAKLHASYASGQPIAWVRVHNLPRFAYFNHSAHVRRGVGCETCHGRVDTMEQVYQAEPLSMGWCLDCHRAPEKYLRDPKDATVMGLDNQYTPEQRAELGRRIKREYNIQSLTDCSTCHR
jgi:menaquinone reductase, multiheme cytochrome c subunit